MAPKIHLHHNDIPADLNLGAEIAIDTELMGLHLIRDRLCLVQLRGRDTDIHLVKIAKGQTSAPHLKKMLEDRASIKILQYARHDIAKLVQDLGIDCAPIFCTKIASKLLRTYADRHGLKDMVREIVGIDISKQQQLTNWGAEVLTPEQLEYAASDVLYLHQLMDYYRTHLLAEGRMDVAQACFDFLPARARLDLMGWDADDIFSQQ